MSTERIEKLYEEYTKQYEYIYDNNVKGYEVAGERDAVTFFVNVIMKKHINLLSEFNGYTGDLIMSDREAAAFVFACENLGMLEGDLKWILTH